MTDAERESGAAPLADDPKAMAEAYMPQLEDLDVATEAEYTWNIPNFLDLPHKALSPVFEAGGYRWRLLLFPEENSEEGSKNFISLYFKALDPNGQDEDEDSDGRPTPTSAVAVAEQEQQEPEQQQKPWAVCVAFLLYMWNPDHPDVYTCNYTYRRLDRRCPDWGYMKFKSLREAFLKETGASAPLIDSEKGNRVNVSAVVRIMDDPTGVLWHDMVDYDSKLETGFVGLKNQGATCYMNSLLQSLYFIKILRRAVFAVPNPDKDSLTAGLQQLFYLLAKSRTPVDTSTLTRAFGWDTADAFTQHDVQELNRVLIDKLEGQMKGTAVDGILTKIFVGQMKSFIKCIDVDFESSRIEDFWDIQLNVKGMKDIYDSFRTYTETELLEGENQYHAVGFGLQDAKKGVIFESFPPVLHLQLKRYDYDFMQDIEIKIHDRYEFPMELDLSPFVDREEDAKNKDEPWIYDLHGVLVHSGDLNTGHYYALIKPDVDAGWYMFDDNFVTRATERDVLEKTYGGGTRKSSAYMLVYIQRSKLDFVFPEGEDTYPDYLPKMVEHEFQEEERRNQERIDKQQHLDVHIHTAADFEHHTGLGFIGSTDDENVPLSMSKSKEADTMLSLRLKRDFTVGQLRQKICEILAFSKDFVLWLVLASLPSQRLVEVVKGDYDNYTMERLNRLDRFSNGDDIIVLVTEPSPEPENRSLVFKKVFDQKQSTLTSDSIQWIDRTQPLGKALNIEDDHTIIWRENDQSIDALRLDATAIQSGLRNGDIVISQRLGDDGPLTAEVIQTGRLAMLDYFDVLINQTTLTLRPLDIVYANELESDEEDEGLPVLVSAKDSYESLSRKIGAVLNVDPKYLKLWSTIPHWQRHDPIYSDGSNLSILFDIHSRGSSNGQPAVLYEILDMPLVQYEKSCELEVIYMAKDLTHIRGVRVFVPIECPLKEVLLAVVKKENTSVARMKIWLIRRSRLAPPASEDALRLNELRDGEFICVSPIPPDTDLDHEDVRLREVFHFDRDTSRPHGVPFNFALLRHETFRDTKIRLQAALGLHDRMFARIKVCLCSPNDHPRRIKDTDILFNIMRERDAIGLDHPADKPRAVYPQAAIVIK